MVQILDIRNGRGGIVTIKWVISIVGLLILSASCARYTCLTSDQERRRSPHLRELSENLEKWRAHGITNYRMRFIRICFSCGRRPVLVDVRNGLVHRAVYEDDGTPVSLSYVRDIHSIDFLFGSIEGNSLRPVYAAYNAKYGYPMHVGFGLYGDTCPTDSGIDYAVELLTIMEEDANVSVHKTPEEIAQAIYGEMVPIPAGRFGMGDLSGDGYDNEKPVYTVMVPAFKLGKYEVTFAQWDACVADGGCNGHRPMGWGFVGSGPVNGVSWDDTQSFIDWLNNRTGRNFRLPTEAEWEYAARAGSTTEYSWGDDMDRWVLYCYDCYGSAPVNSFPANAWGLHNMHGNVAEWVQDCYHNSYEGAPTDGSARTSEDCSRRVIRGGSWDDLMWFLRSASRGRNALSIRSHGGIGFRLAHDE